MSAFKTTVCAFAFLMVIIMGGCAKEKENDNTPVASITAVPLSVEYGGSAVVSWTSSNTTSCSVVDGDGIEVATGVSGAYDTPALMADMAYSVSCVGLDGVTTASDLVTIVVGAEPIPSVTLTASPSSVAFGGTSVLSWNSANTASCSLRDAAGAEVATSLSGSYTTPMLFESASYTVACVSTGTQITISDTRVVTVEPFSLNFRAEPVSITSGDEALLMWDITPLSSSWRCAVWGEKFFSPLYVESFSVNFYPPRDPPPSSVGTGPLAASAMFRIICQLNIEGDTFRFEETATVAVSAILPDQIPTMDLFEVVAGMMSSTDQSSSLIEEVEPIFVLRFWPEHNGNSIASYVTDGIPVIITALANNATISTIVYPDPADNTVIIRTSPYWYSSTGLDVFIGEYHVAVEFEGAIWEKTVTLNTIVQPGQHLVVGVYCSSTGSKYLVTPPADADCDYIWFGWSDIVGYVLHHVRVSATDGTLLGESYVFPQDFFWWNVSFWLQNNTFYRLNLRVYNWDLKKTTQLPAYPLVTQIYWWIRFPGP